MTTKRVILYTRVSTDEQAKNGTSLQTQLEAIRKYATEHGFEIVAEFADDYTGTVPIEYRPEGKKAFELLRSGDADAVIVYTVDRLVRPPEDGDEWDTPVLVRGLAKLGKEIHTVEDGQIKTDFASLLIAMLKAKTAGEERRKIIERTTRGKHQKAKNGEVVGTGKPPYGYIYHDGALIINSDEADIVRMIYTWYIQDHLALRRIAYKLSEMSVPTPQSKNGRGTTLWSHSVVQRLIASEVYHGVWRYGRRIGNGGRGGKRALADTTAVPVPPIIDDDAWLSAQRIMEHNSEIAQRNRKRTYLLSGMVRCGCGRAMHGQLKNGGKNLTYRCSEHCNRHQKLVGRVCYEPSYDGLKLEAAVWAYVYKLLSEDFEEDLRAAQQAEREKHEPLLREVEIVDRLLKEVSHEAEQLATALRTASGIVAEKLRGEITGVNKRFNDLTTRKQKLLLNLQNRPLTPVEIETLQQFRKHVSVGLDKATDAHKRKLYEILQIRATVKDGKVQVSCIIESVTSNNELHRY